MAPVLKTGIVKKLSRVRIPLSPVAFFNNHIYWSGLVQKKRIARLDIAELQGSSWKVFEKTPIPPIWEIDVMKLNRFLFHLVRSLVSVKRSH